MTDLPETDLEQGLNPPLLPFDGGIPIEVATARHGYEARNTATKEVYAQRIDIHLDQHRKAIDYLDRSHQWIADTYDFEMKGHTRLAAIWQMGGRCIAIARLILDSLALGHTTEVVHSGRAVHEANRLLNVFHMQNEDAIVLRWLAGEYVSPGECRQAEERFDRFLAEQMQAQGHAPMSTIRGEKSREMYGYLSEAAHHRRKWVEDLVYPEERLMVTGPTDDYFHLAATVGSFLLLIEETVIGVGDAISMVVPQEDWYEKNVEPMLAGFAELRTSHPLPSEESGGAV